MLMKKNLYCARYFLWVWPLFGIGIPAAQAEAKPPVAPQHTSANQKQVNTVLFASGADLKDDGLKKSRQADVTVRGKVTGEDGEGLPGVTVQVKGTSRGTSTDMDGSFTIAVPSNNATLIFSYIGYSNQEVAVNNQSTINVSLKPDAKALEEVVVTGYGTQRKADVVVAVASVEGEAVAERGTVSPIQAVQGQVAGVDIAASSGRAGAGYNVQIRGQNSLAGGQPLYVVDGVIVPDINFLNPQDIAKLDVLKDAASTAIYGSRGSNGVVIVTTKQGSSVKGGATISYDGYYGVRQVARMPDFFSGAEWWEYRLNSYISPELIAGRDNYDQTIDRLAGL